jgi:G:T/U-mismatch repair DNA glycosylase
MTEIDGPDIPGSDALIAAREAQHDQLNLMTAIGSADSAVAAARVQDWADQQRTAQRRWRAAKGSLTKARRDGSATAIAAARERCGRAYAEFVRLSEAAIAETLQNNHARLEELGATMRQARHT